MSKPVISLSEDQIFIDLRSFLLSVLPDGIPVIKGQDNRVAPPTDTDFVVMTPLFRKRLSTNKTSYFDGTFTNVDSQRYDYVPYQFTVQVDVIGNSSYDNSAAITTYFRSDYATAYFKNLGHDIQPMYCIDPHQSPFNSGEQQSQFHWMIEVNLQANTTLSLAGQEFADSISVDMIAAP